MKSMFSTGHETLLFWYPFDLLVGIIKQRKQHIFMKVPVTKVIK